MQVQLKLDEKGTPVVQDDKPVYVDADGREIVFDYAATLATISRKNGEAKAQRERAEAAEERLKGFEGIEDPALALEAINTVKNLDSKKLFDAGKVEEIKAEAKRAFDDQVRGIEEKYKPVIAERDGLKSALNKEIIGGAFNRSKFISDKLAIPADLVEAKFGQFFTLDDNKIVAQDTSGQRIYSRANPGEIADFDEALETLVSNYSNRDTILKGSGASGSGAHSSQQIVNGKRAITRAAFDALSPTEKMQAAKEMTVVD